MEKLDGSPNDEEVQRMLELYSEWDLVQAARESTVEWQTNNMEYDLRTTDWILEKTRNSDVYAQHMYAAMCNREFIKYDIPDTADNFLKALADDFPKWSCSWRHAGGIIADMQGKGDYINWYCSGINNPDDITDDEFQSWTIDQQEYYMKTKQYVGESHVTEEIRKDLRRLGWSVIDDQND